MSRWRSWTPDDDPLPRVSACYVIYVDGILSYVGQAENVRSRLGNHLRIARYSSRIETPWGAFLDVTVKYRPSEKYGDFAMIERRLIRRLRPRFNKQLYQRPNKKAGRKTRKQTPEQFERCLASFMDSDGGRMLGRERCRRILLGQKVWAPVRSGGAS